MKTIKITQDDIRLQHRSDNPVYRMKVGRDIMVTSWTENLRNIVTALDERFTEIPLFKCSKKKEEVLDQTFKPFADHRKILVTNGKMEGYVGYFREEEVY